MLDFVLGDANTWNIFLNIKCCVLAFCTDIIALNCNLLVRNDLITLTYSTSVQQACEGGGGGGEEGLHELQPHTNTHTLCTTHNKTPN